MYSELIRNYKNCGIKSPQDNICHTDPPGISGWLCEGRISYDAFVLNNKKDAIYYSGPFSCTAQTITIKEGETFDVWGFNYDTSFTGSSSATGKATVSVSGNKATITGVADGSAVITLTDAASPTAHTTTINVTVVD